MITWSRHSRRIYPTTRSTNAFCHRRAALRLEILARRHQLQVLERTRRRRAPLTRADRKALLADYAYRDKQREPDERVDIEDLRKLLGLR
jgi:hypothetical protein